MINDLSLNASRCMDAIREHVGTVELETFIYFIRSSGFDYTKWQREHYGAMTPDEINRMLDDYSENNTFRGKKAVVI